MSYRFVDSFPAGPGWNSVPPWSCSKAVSKPVWHTPLLSVQWINSWWWTDELSETCRVSWQNKLVKLVHVVAFITKKSVKNSEDITFLLILCSTMRLQGIVLMYTSDKMALARPVMELCFFCFVSHHSFCPVTNHASVEYCRDVREFLPLILSQYSVNQQTVCKTRHWRTPFQVLLQCCYLSETFTTSHINSRYFKYIYISPKMPHC